MSQYTTKTAVQNYLLTNINASFDTQLTAYIEAMSDFIDRRAGYPIFVEDETTRLYDGSGATAQLISPVHTITEVLVDTVEPSDTILLKYPYNSDIKTQLTLKSGIFTDDLANVSVTGKHCLAVTLPEKIKWACTVLVAGIVNQVNNQTEGVQSEKVGEYQVSYRDSKERNDYKLALEIIDSYRRITF
ncbi:MAG: hypothetical protein C0429_09690 [Sphingopyxis sp.]|nr:hypothetical protein [Sphingopyxis sp.]